MSGVYLGACLVIYGIGMIGTDWSFIRYKKRRGCTAHRPHLGTLKQEEESEKARRRHSVK